MPDIDTLGDIAPPAAESTTDRASFRVAAFGAVLVVVLFAGYGIGRLNDGAAVSGAPAVAAGHAGDASAEHGHGGDTGAGAGSAPGATGGQAPGATDGQVPGATVPHDDPGTAAHVHNADGTVTPAGGGTPAQTGSAVGGLALTSAGLTMTPESTTFRAGTEQPLRFRVTGTGGAPVTTYAVVHDKPLHLVVIRRDLSGFQHLHPTMAPDGTWGIGLKLAQPGSYRAIADFTAIVGGQQVPATLGVDLTVAGSYAPVALPAPVREATAGGFAVSYEGAPQVGSSQPLLMTVAGAKLEPYLGAYGHLVMLREGDVGYVHVHPEAELVDGKVKFWLTAPGPGRYRMFFDFQVAGRVHTAAWTAVVR